MCKDKILVVDDEPNVVDLVRIFLEKANFQVVTARNGYQAMEQYKMTNPDLIVLDIMMPGLNGLEVCQAIRRESNVPIIMLTALSSDIDELTGLESGADDYMTKPFSPTELVARVQAVLRRIKGKVAPQ